MPDWINLVRQRLADLDLPADSKEQVISELAAHLQDIYERASARSLSHDEAQELALQDVDDWRALANRIRRSKGDTMNRRSRTLWIPALATILAASIAMRLLQWAGVRPQLVWTGPVALSFYWIWLGSLPFCGALGAWLSQRAGGSARLRLLSALSPVLWMLGFAVLVEPIELAFNGMRHLVYFGYGATNWIVIPGLALFVGATPFLRQHARVTPTPQS